MRAILLFFGSISVLLGIYVLVYFPYVLMTETGVSPRIIDSFADKLFFGFLSLGAAIFCAGVGFILFSKGNKEETNNTKNLWNIVFLGAFLFLIGIVYHPIAGSPW